MKPMNHFGAAGLALVLMLGPFGAAIPVHATTVGDELYRQALQSIDSENYIRATQLLTRLIANRDTTYSERAQELLGNVREANGQLAHAKAEYEIYLAKYPQGEGASRVRGRLASILSGRSTGDSSPVIAGAALAAPAPGSAAKPVANPGKSDAVAASTDPDRGLVTLTYRHNQTATDITELVPDTVDDLNPADDDGNDDNAVANRLTSGLQYSRVIDKGDRRIRLSFAGFAETDLDDGGDTRLRISEALVAIENKTSGSVLTFGRQRLEPQGMGYRADGVSLKWTIDNGVVLGAVLGTVVDSTRDDLFSDDRFLVGASATFKEMIGPGDLSIYGVTQTDGSRTYRSAVGAEYDFALGRADITTTVEYDLKFRKLNRIVVSGAMAFEDGSRLTGRFAHYHGPGLNLQNALIGQPVDTIDDLLLTNTPAQVESLALDRSARITTLGMTYYTNLNEKWDLGVDATLLDSSGTPASGGVAAIADSGVKGYFGVRLLGGSVFRPEDQLSLGLRAATSDESTLLVIDTSWRVRVTDELTVQPRLRLGHRDIDAGGNENFVIPSLNLRYKVNRETALQVDLGGRWSDTETPTLETERNEFFLTAGISRSF
jgi:hypothetical protein